MNFELFLQTLPIMLIGMVGIFVVTALIIGAMALLNFFSTKVPTRKDK